MKKFFSLILSCFVLPGATVALLLTVAGIARADIINTFNVSGSAVNQTDSSVGSCGVGYACPFSGTLVVDVYEGTAPSANITFPGLSAFTPQGTSSCSPLSRSRDTSDWELDACNSSSDSLFLVFTTSETPGSLVGFEGGSVVEAIVNSAGGVPIYGALSGSIAPAQFAAAPVAEPSTFSLWGLALIAGLWLGRKQIFAHSARS